MMLSFLLLPTVVHAARMKHGSDVGGVTVRTKRGSGQFSEEFALQDEARVWQNGTIFGKAVDSTCAEKVEGAASIKKTIRYPLCKCPGYWPNAQRVYCGKEKIGDNHFDAEDVAKECLGKKPYCSKKATTTTTTSITPTTLATTTATLSTTTMKTSFTTSPGNAVESSCASNVKGAVSHKKQPYPSCICQGSWHSRGKVYCGDEQISGAIFNAEDVTKKCPAQAPYCSKTASRKTTATMSTTAMSTIKASSARKSASAKIAAKLVSRGGKGMSTTAKMTSSTTTTTPTAVAATTTFTNIVASVKMQVARLTPPQSLASKHACAIIPLTFLGFLRHLL